MIKLFVRPVVTLDWGDEWTAIEVTGDDEAPVVQVIVAKLHRAGFEISREVETDDDEGEDDE